MTQITNVKDLNPDVTWLDLAAPHVAKKARPGQFVILRNDAEGERYPLTIANTDIENGHITVIVQKLGKSTSVLAQKKPGEYISDLLGPLGMPTRLTDKDGKPFKKVAVVGGGLGCAIAWPIAKALKEQGTEIHMIAGFRNKDIVILEEEMMRDTSFLHICTDDGSYGTKGFVTDKLQSLITSGDAPFDHVFAIGPLIMMKFVAKLTREAGIPTTVSMNPIMVDGTGMCGCCRVTVGGQVRFACVDGPDFDGHEVDFDETIKRNAAYREFEARKLKEHQCNLFTQHS